MSGHGGISDVWDFGFPADPIEGGRAERGRSIARGRQPVTIGRPTMREHPAIHGAYADGIRVDFGV
jgi:hypothetical protein